MMEKFEEYFKRADLDKDGRISGDEAYAFFQASNLPRPTLAQIWQHTDENRNGFLGRQEFFNALKLVTVAQSKRELTPDIVKASLYGPDSSKIPAPQINLAALPPAQQNAMGPLPQLENYFFDNFLRYDSFSATDQGSPEQETFSRFDSTSSSTHDNNFSKFDSMSSTAQDHSFARFDLISSNAGFDHGYTYSFDDSDPFGSSGPFKASSESQTGKNETDK